MKMQTYFPSAALTGFIKAYHVIETDDELINRIIPNTSLALAFQFKGSINYVINGNTQQLPQITFSGLRKSVRFINYTPGSGAIIVMFKETGAAAFFKDELQLFFESSIALDDIMHPSAVLLLREKMLSATGDIQRIEIIEQFLVSRLSYPQEKENELIKHAILAMRSAGGIIKINALAKSLYISQDAFEKRFRKTVGATPKQFAAIIQMNNIIHQPSNDTSLLSLAVNGNYYDASHLTKAFKVFTGLTPTDFFKSAAFW